MLPGIHWPELLIVIAVALLIFGPKRLPEMGSAIGKPLKEFRKSMHELGDMASAAPPPALPPALPPTTEPRRAAAPPAPPVNSPGSGS